MNEILLVIITIALLVLPQFLMPVVKKSTSKYIKIVATVILLTLVWVFGNEGKWPVKIILSAIAMTALLKEYLSQKQSPS